MNTQIESISLEQSQPASKLARLFNIFFILAIIIGTGSGFFVVRFGQPVYILLALVAVLIFAFAIISLQFGLLVTVFLVYTRFSDVIVHNFSGPSIAQAFIAIIILAILVRWAIFREVPMGWQQPTLLLVVFGLFGFSSMIYAHDTTRVATALGFYVRDAIIAVVVAVLLQTGTSFRRLIWVFILVGIFLGTLSAYQFLTGSFTNSFGGFANAQVMQILGATNDYRLGGPVGDPNFFAQILVVIVPLALERLMHDPRMFRKILALWCLIVVVLSIMFTYSRGGFVALVAAIFIFFIFYPPRTYHIPIFIVSILLLFSIAPHQYFDRILSLNQFFGKSTLGLQDPALRSRVTENLTAWEMVKSNPLVGVGLSNYSTVYAVYSRILGYPIPAIESAAHNLYLEVLAETGILGFSVFALIIFHSLRRIIRARAVFLHAYLSDYTGMATSFLIGLIGYLIASMFVHGAYPRYFYLLVGIALSLELVARNVVSNRLGPAARVEAK